MDRNIDKKFIKKNRKMKINFYHFVKEKDLIIMKKILSNNEMKNPIGFTLVYSGFEKDSTTKYSKVYVNKENGEIHVEYSFPFAKKTVYNDFTTYYRFLNGKLSFLSTGFDGREHYIPYINVYFNPIKNLLNDLKLLK
jgi:hypothetical protein